MDRDALLLEIDRYCDDQKSCESCALSDWCEERGDFWNVKDLSAEQIASAHAIIEEDLYGHLAPPDDDMIASLLEA